MPKFFKLVEYDSHSGLSPGDLLVEVTEATLAAGTVEVPTQFEDGQIVAVFATRDDSATVNNGQAFTSDLVVTSGAVTVSGPTASAVKFNCVVIGKSKI